MSIRSKRSGFGMRCAFPPEINATRTCVVAKRSSARLTVALRRQRSHVRIVSGAPDFSLFYNAICAPEPKLQCCLIRASKQSGENRRRE
jgi:hypothetical protein